MTSHLIGFCGPAGAGKTTAALALVATLPDCCRLSFADPIRAMLYSLGLGPEDLQTYKEKPHPLLGGKTPRFAMQTLGTEWARQTICDDLWLRVARQRALTALQDQATVVFDDVRFDNEAQMIRRLGGIIIKVTRPDLPQSSAHASEAGLTPALINTTIEAIDPAHLRTQLLGYLGACATISRSENCGHIPRCQHAETV